jgi:hypothetical protein
MECRACHVSLTILAQRLKLDKWCARILPSPEYAG